MSELPEVIILLQAKLRFDEKILLYWSKDVFLPVVYVFLPVVVLISHFLMQMLSEMQILKKHVRTFLGSFQATQTAATGTQECRNSLLFQYTYYHLCNSPTL